MRISIIDNVDFTDTQIEKLTLIGDIKIYKDNSNNEAEILKRCADAEILILGWTRISRSILSKLNKLRFISVWATGYDYIDMEYANQKNILVSNVPNYASISVAEFTMGLMLAASRHIFEAHNNVIEGHYSWGKFKGFELAGKTLGIVGLGNIGTYLAQLALAFDMKIICHTKNPNKTRNINDKIQFVPLTKLFSASDFISINVPLNGETHNLIDKDILSQMNSNAFIINTSRKEIINQRFLVEMLINQKIKGAALDDIFIDDTRIRELDNVLLTPHIGFFTEEAIIRKSEVCIDNVISFTKGNLQNIVNYDF